jgi:hypothetical protein
MQLLESVEGLPSQGQGMVELSELATWKIILLTITGNVVTSRQMLVCMSNKTRTRDLWGISWYRRMYNAIAKVLPKQRLS